MKYNLDKKVDRRNTGSVKWNVSENELPMWVADMDFESAKDIKDIMMKIAEHGVYGYADLDPEFFNAYIYWWKERYQTVLEKDWFVYSTGVIAALSSIVRKLTTAGENVLLQLPVYNCFFTSIENNGRKIVSNDLVYQDGSYFIDFNDLEEKLKDKQTSMMILCNPHNPVGHIFTKEELEKIRDLTQKYHVILVADEIHCDLLDPGYKYTPIMSIDGNKDNIVMLASPSKSFNLAGLHGAVAVIENENLRHKVWRGINTDEVGEANIFVQQAHIMAYTKSGDWLDEVREYIYQNKQYFINFIKENIPHLHVVDSHATYLLWVDISYYDKDSTHFVEDLRKQTGLFVTEGVHYGKNGEGFLRINMATQKENVKDACNRLLKYINQIK